MSRSDDYFRAVEQQLEKADRARTFSDEAKRAADIINGHLVSQPDAVRKWVAIRLSDGSSDNVLYDTKAHAVRYQLDEYQCLYVCIPPTGTSPEQMSAMIDLHRALYDKGARMVDPDDEQTGGPQYVPPVQLEDLRRQQHHLHIPKSVRWRNG